MSRPISPRDEARPAPLLAELTKRSLPSPRRRYDAAPIEPGMITGCPACAGQAPFLETNLPFSFRVMLCGMS
jgi:hypothetical protein